MFKLALGIEYSGINYYGWQKQFSLPTIQDSLEKSLSKVANEKIITFCAGRTDAKVHATGQVVHFETNSYRTNIQWIQGINKYLPKDITVNWIIPIMSHFHARNSAIARRYRYIIYNYRQRPAIFFNGLTHYRYPLNIQKMEKASKYLIGEHDFNSFRASDCQSNSSWRNLHHLIIYRQGRYLIIDIKASSFLHHMVRKIVGSLIEVGNGNKPEKWIEKLLFLKNSKLNIPIAGSEGLYLVKVYYNYVLPSNPLGPIFL